MNHITTIHNGCPNNNHCEKDNTKCCYLNHEKQCLIHEYKIKGETPK